MTPAQRRSLAQALLDAFPTREALSEFAAFRLDLLVEQLSLRTSLSEMVGEFVAVADARGLAERLVRSAIAAAPRSEGLRELAVQLNLVSRADEIEALVAATGRDLTAWRSQIGTMTARVCRMGDLGGSGLLIAPDLVLTTGAVVRLLTVGEKAPAAVTFDETGAQESGSVTGGVLSSLAPKWDVARDRRLDLAIVALAGEPGRSTIGGSSSAGSGAIRGWIHLDTKSATPPDADVSPDIVAVDRSFAGEARLRLGKILEHDRVKGRARAEFVPPCVNAPCFDLSWQFVGVLTTDGTIVDSARVARLLAMIEREPAGPLQVDPGLAPSISRLDNQLRSFAPAAKASPESALLSQYRQAAAVLAYYSPSSLVTAVDPETIRALLAESTPVNAPGKPPRWMLRSDIRRKTLHQLGRNGARRALANVADPSQKDEPLQQLLAAALRGEPIVVDADDDPARLRAMLQVRRWVRDIVPELPDEDELQRAIERANVLQPFRHLAGSHFRGRKEELRILAEYLGLREPASAITRVVWEVRRILSLVEQPPLMVYGPGGVGKSSLISRFILDHVDDAHLRVPFLYFDFDRPGLIAEEPVTLLIDGLRQLSTQFSQAREPASALAEKWATEVNRGGRDGATALAPTVRTSIIHEFADLFSLIQTGETPLLLVLDTFEEVQRRNRAFVETLWGFLEELQANVPWLRTVIVGRAPIIGYRTRELRLEELDAEAAEAFFLHALGRTDPALAATIVRQVGRNPLSLKLAVEVARREDARGGEGIRDLKTRHLFVVRVREQDLQGVLYRRILEHIGDPDVRKLAHPGLILRRITAEIIKEVLAEPCGVIVRDGAHAAALLAALAAEVSLVQAGSDGALYHRSDVRRVMLSALRRDQRGLTDEIQQRAIRYYEHVTDPVARAEEIYHRLALDEEIGTVEARWISGVGDYLGSAIEELSSARAQAYLANRLGIEVPPELRVRIGLEEWAQYAARSASALTEAGSADKALALLRERSERSPASPLFIVEARALCKLAEPDLLAAHAAVTNGLTSIAAAGDNQQLLELLILGAALCDWLERFAEGQALLDEAEPLARRSADPQHWLEIAMRRLRMARRGPRDAQPDERLLERTRDEAAATLEEMSEARLERLGALGWQLAAELLSDRPLAATRVRVVSGGLAEPIDDDPRVRASAERQRNKGVTPARECDLLVVSPIAAMFELISAKLNARSDTTAVRFGRAASALRPRALDVGVALTRGDMTLALGPVLKEAKPKVAALVCAGVALAEEVHLGDVIVPRSVFVKPNTGPDVKRVLEEMATAPEYVQAAMELARGRSPSPGVRQLRVDSIYGDGGRPSHSVHLIAHAPDCRPFMTRMRRLAIPMFIVCEVQTDAAGEPPIVVNAVLTLLELLEQVKDVG
jgi:hypothetical protein